MCLPGGHTAISRQQLPMMPQALSLLLFGPFLGTRFANDAGYITFTGNKAEALNKPYNLTMTAYKQLRQGDETAFAKLIQLFDEVFENEIPASPNTKQLTNLLKTSGFISFVAIDNNEVIGGLTAYELPSYYSEQSEVYIYDIAVKQHFQRKGIGKQLLSSLTEFCRQNNINTMFVEAHEQDKGAVDFYHKAGGQAEKVVHFNFIVNEK